MLMSSESGLALLKKVSVIASEKVLNAYSFDLPPVERKWELSSSNRSWRAIAGLMESKQYLSVEVGNWVGLSTGGSWVKEVVDVWEVKRRARRERCVGMV